MSERANPSVKRRSLLTLALAAPLVPALAILPRQEAMASPRPVRPRVRRLPLHEGTLRSDTGPQSSLRPGHRAYVTERVEVEPFRVAGFTWDSGPTDAIMQIRTRERGGWSQWFTLHDDGHGPEPGMAESRTARRGTDPIVVGESDAVEVRIETRHDALPRGLRIDMIDPGTSDADHIGDSLPSTAGVPGLTQPVVRSRADWGADESMRYPQTDYGVVLGTFVHHTAGSNNYTEADVPAIIRGIYAFHVEGRGWWDIGYNFVIDKFGRIWEGRYGGMDQAPVAAHTLGYNAHAFGAAVLGNYVSKEPEAAVLRAFEELTAWKFAVHGVAPEATVAYPGNETLPAISGHLDGYPTLCPGQRVYARLGTIRNGVRQILDETAVASQLTLRAHTTAARADKRIWFEIDWFAGSVGVSGTVRLQRRSGSSWATVRTATVRDGAGVSYAIPPDDRTYRLQSITSSEPLNVAQVTSNSRTIQVVQSSTNVTMSRAGATRPNGEVPIDVEWRVGSVGVTGQLELQYYRNGSWHRARDAHVVNGVGTTVLRPSRSQVYRLRGISASSPSNAVTTHPASTSNEFRVVVN